ncbi:MAG TPA: ABC transporter substrate-binding protein [Clostridiales bacterium]|jgi:NitT/TauT family transport system substrate-binding protein|nr:ABC transporter substrate-binding protein [Clostridiales bacterium]
MKRLFSIILATILALSLFVIGHADEYVVKVSSPSGAPGLALVTLAVQNPENYTYLTAETITAEFANETADFIIAPLNAGAKLYKAGKSTYQLAAIVSWGNLFLASQRENFTLEDINGGTITMFGEKNINSSIAKFVLAENGITPGNIEYLAGASNTQKLMLSDAQAIVLTAEPALTAARMKNDKITAYSINELYKAVTGHDGFTQAALFVRKQTLENHPEVVDNYLKLVEESCDKCATDIETVAEAAAKMEILPNKKVAMLAIPNCSIRYMSALDAREQIEITANIDLEQFGGTVPSDDFYYGTK